MIHVENDIVNISLIKYVQKKGKSTMFNSKKNVKMFSAGLAAVMMVLTMAGCSSPETGDVSKADVKETASSAAESAEEAKGEESAAESVAEETENTESSEAAATTEAPDDFDIDAMIASIEAEIPEITAYSAADINIDPTLEDTSSASEAGTTTTTTMPEANSPAVADLKSYQQFSFDGTTYDNANIIGGIAIPSGWEDKGRSTKDYKNPLYPDYDIVVSDNSVQFMKTRDEDGNKPSLQLYKGLTWGASVADVKAAYGEPMHEGSSSQYGTSFTNMFYKDSDGLLIIYQVSSDWGLAGILCEGRN